MLAQWQGDSLQEPEVTRVAELSSRLKYPGRLVAVASATLDGEEGWAVLDGPRSTWYPRADQPAETDDSTILRIHVGRQLLGFRDPPRRKRYLVAAPAGRAPSEIIAAYEKLMAEATGADPNRQRELWDSIGPLARYVGRYVDALAAVNEVSRPEALVDVYHRLLRMAEQADESVHDTVYDSMGVLGEQFMECVDAILSRGRSVEIATLVEVLAPHWDDSLGHSRLGDAAFGAGLWDVAERHLLKSRDGEYYYHSDGMDQLAEIWHSRGEEERARQLLVDCLRRLLAEIQGSQDDSDRRMLADDFDGHRATYLRFFPNGENELAGLGIPAEPG